MQTFRTLTVPGRTLARCWNGNSNALNYVKLTSNFFSGIGASKIVDGYDLNGKEHAQEQMASDDPDAIVWAKQLVDGHDIELRSGARLISRLERKPK